ncbi:ribbon-helix-helix protein, CopG family [Euzebya sp.]|uniref:ribbon-helix-helix protein, CopG family n=1 Tax=Euzebya sp. TaxID=1971409 RepID=UPI003514AF5E
MSYSERTQVLLTRSQRDKVERLAAEAKRSVGQVIRDAIDAYNQPDANRRREGLDALMALNAPVGDWEDLEREIIDGAAG